MVIQKNTRSGKVVLAGAGPGDPELITLKAWRYISKADVLIIDRLVDDSLLNDAKPEAKIIFVGKEGGNPLSTSQDTINELLVEYAEQNKLVLRLKGGDVSFFSNIMGEIETLVSNGIPYEIIPGVTAASGAAAYTGIPLTARGLSSSVRFLSYTGKEVIDDNVMRELAATEDTLVFYMGSSQLPSLVHRLLSEGASHEKWVAAIEQATTPYQQVHAYPIHEFRGRMDGKKYTSPTLIIIGKVVQLYEKFNWWTSSESERTFFKPVTAQYQNSDPLEV